MKLIIFRFYIFKMVQGRKWVLKRHFSGEPKLDDFELVEEELPELKDGEIMFRYSGLQWENNGIGDALDIL